jgi:excisionase family DNA binding protein
MEDNIRGQMSIDDIGTDTNTQQNTSSAQNAPSQERAHEYKQHIAESVQTQSDSPCRNDTAQSFTDKPKSSSQNSFRRNYPHDHRNNNGGTAPEHFHGRLNENRTNEYNTVTNENECDISTSESCETAPATAGTRHRHRKAQYSNISPISDMQMLTPDDIMQALRLSRSTVYNMLKRGEIPSVKIGNMLRVNKSAFEHWLEQHTAAAHSV